MGLREGPSPEWQLNIFIVTLFAVFGLIYLLILLTGASYLTRKGRLERIVVRIINSGGWLSIHSSRDEAIVALANAASIVPTYVTVDAAVRSIVRLGVVIGAAAAIIAAGLLFFYVPVPQPWSGWWFPHLPRAYYLIAAVLVATLLYLAVYGAFWVLARCGGGRLYAALMNCVIQGGVMGAVYGDDAQYKVTGISGSRDQSQRCSSHHGAIRWCR